MLDARSMRAFLPPAVTALAALALSCGPGTPPQPPSVAAATARALVRPYVAGNALLRKAPPPGGAGPRVVPGPTAVVLAHQAEDGTIRVGCVDSEDGAEDLVRSVEDAR
jgi:hypothetical protein